MAPSVTAFDEHMMAVALMMARRGLGLAAPNPSVGAVIADEASGELISRAVTAPGGRPHAEPLAIAAAGERARGATIYVTLEPCSHFGKTPPCADAIIAAGMKRAVVAIEDPDPRVAGRGLDRLRAAGIEVVRGVGAAEARWIARGHIVRVTERRPLVTLKLALDADGNVPRGGGGKPLFVTSAQTRAHAHVLRAMNEAILVGSATVRDDDPALTCRLPGLEARSPLRVVLARTLSLPPEAKTFAQDAPGSALVVTASGSEPETVAALKEHGVEVDEVPAVAGRIWLPAVMETLVARGITRLIVEGGPTIWRAFANHALCDEVTLYVAGAHAAGVGSRQALSYAQRWLGRLPLTLVAERRLGPDTLFRLRFDHPGKGS